MKAPKGTSYDIEIDGRVGYFKSTPFDVLDTAIGFIMNIMNDPDYQSAGELILNSCWLGGDKKLKTENLEDICHHLALNCMLMKEGEIEERIKLDNSREDKTKVPVGAKYIMTIGDKKCYLKDISRETFSSITGKMMPIAKNPKYLTAGETALHEVFISGDEEIKTPGSDYYITACFKLATKYLTFKEAKIKKY